MKSKIKISLVIIAFGLFFGGAVIVFGQADESSISFPIVKLGNCANKQDCRKYCDNPSNIKQCLAFAKEHNLLTTKELEDAERFMSVLEDGGPGGCRDRSSCETYCEDVSHLDQCLAFAESKKLMTQEQIREAKMVAQALKQGASLPGECKNKTACEQYCENKEHVEECLSFAEKAGFISSEEAKEALRVLPFIKNGETPGGCVSKKECDMYCKDDAHFDECVKFAEKAGLISPEDLAMLQKTGGRGPGGCSSKASCETYCNVPQNQNACFDFAEEHGLIPEDKLKEIKEGMGRLRTGLIQAPGEVVDCLKSKFGPDVIGRIESGSFVPGPDAGAMIKACFDLSLEKVREKIKNALGSASPETLDCLNQNLGADWLAKIENGDSPSPEIGDKMRMCFREQREEGLRTLREGINKAPLEMQNCVREILGQDVYSGIISGADVEVGPESKDAMEECLARLQNRIREKLNAIPADARECLKKIYGNDFFDRVLAGEREMPQDVQTKIETCLKEQAAQNAPVMPAEARVCIDEVYGAGTAQKMLLGEFAEPSDFKQRIENCIREKMIGAGRP